MIVLCPLCGNALEVTPQIRSLKLGERWFYVSFSDASIEHTCKKEEKI